MPTRTIPTIVFTALLLASAGPVRGFMLPCESLYTEGVSEFQAGNFGRAEQLLLEATTLAPEPDAENGGYLPYLYLAAARFERGDVRGAREALVQSQVYGVAQETDLGRRLIENYAVDIMSAPLPTEDQFAPQSSPVIARDSALSEIDADLIRSRVLRRCALSDEVADNKLPWYFHYLLGLEYAEHGDSSRALHAFQLGANMQEEPSRSKRLYGMWFMDYLPYYQIALAHAELGEWEDAREALYVSLAVGEFEEGKRGWEDFMEMEDRLDQALGNEESS